jgi:hypothetical protein
MQQNTTPGDPFLSACNAPPIKKEEKCPKTTKRNRI